MLLVPILLAAISYATKRTRGVEDQESGRNVKQKTSELPSLSVPAFLFPKLCQSHPLPREIVAAFEVKKPVYDECYKDGDLSCREWYFDYEGGRRIVEIENSLPSKADWSDELEPTRANGLFLLAILKPNKEASYVKALIGAVERASQSGDWKNENLANAMLVLAGLYVARQCTEDVTIKQSYTSAIGLVRAMITREKSPKLFEVYDEISDDVRNEVEAFDYGVRVPSIEASLKRQGLVVNKKLKDDIELYKKKEVELNGALTGKAMGLEDLWEIMSSIEEEEDMKEKLENLGIADEIVAESIVAWKQAYEDIKSELEEQGMTEAGAEACIKAIKAAPSVDCIKDIDKLIRKALKKLEIKVKVVKKMAMLKGYILDIWNDALGSVYQLVTPNPRQNQLQLDLPLILKDLEDKDFSHLGALLDHGTSLECKTLFSILVDWKEAAKATDLSALFVPFASMVKSVFHGTGLTDDKTALIKRYIRYDLFRKVSEKKGPMREEVRNLLVRQPQPHFGAILCALAKSTVLQDIPAISDEDEAKLMAEIKLVKSWYKWKRISEWVEGNPNPELNIFEFERDDGIEIMRLWGEANWEKSKWEKERVEAFDNISLTVFSKDQEAHSYFVSLTAATYLAGRIEIDDVLSRLVKAVGLNHSDRTFFAFFADHILSIIARKNVSAKASLEGGFAQDSALVLIETFLKLYQNPPQDSPIPPAKVKETLVMLLKFHLADASSDGMDPDAMYRLLIEKMAEGETLLLPASSRDHAMVYTIRKDVTLGDEEVTHVENDPFYHVDIYNSGYGIPVHQSADGLYMPYKSYRVRLSQLAEKRYLFNPYAPHEEFRQHFYFDANFAVPVSDDLLKQRAKSTQKAGTCYAKSLLFWLQTQLDTREQYLWFKAYSFSQHRGAIKAAVQNQTNLSVDRDEVDILAGGWSVPGESVDCLRGIVDDTDATLYQTVARHYGFRLFKDLRKLKGNYSPTLNLIKEFLNDDVSALECIGEIEKSLLNQTEDTDDVLADLMGENDDVQNGSFGELDELLAAITEESENQDQQNDKIEENEHNQPSEEEDE